MNRQDKQPGHNHDPAYPRPPVPPLAAVWMGDKLGLSHAQAPARGIGADALAEWAKSMMASAEAQRATTELLLQSVDMLAGAVAQLLEDEAGTPAPHEDPAKPGPDDLDAD